MSNQSKHIAIIGAGLVGSMLSIFLAKRGYKVSVFERRSDMRKTHADVGRSINLALSTRGLSALEEIGLADETKKIAIPMNGRMMHDKSGNLTFQAYGKEGQFINSISRSGLNTMLMDKAEAHNVGFFFNKKCTNINFDNTSVTFQSEGSGNFEALTFDWVVGADGAFSSVRSAMQITDRFDYSQHYLEHGYKELHIPADKKETFALEKNALHIWPREKFMMIALPNPDGSFTCTLFFPFEGEVSFDALPTAQKILSFFEKEFPDALKLMPDLLNDFCTNPTSSLVTIKCFPWVRNNLFLIGDAAHGIVPFYGQGMNAGFEDCRLLNQLLNEYHDDWISVLPEFQKSRKKDTDAIAQLAFDNFIEMRDLVGDPHFLLRKKIEAKLHELYPERWIPLYSMVTFNEKISYSQAFLTGQKQKKIMDQVMKKAGIADQWHQLNFLEIVDQLN